jgi:hypothetical protein
MNELAVVVTVRDLNAGDIAVLGWSGSPTQLVSVREQLGRVQSGQVEYLAACRSRS